MKAFLLWDKVVLVFLFFSSTFFLNPLHSQEYLDYIGAGHNNGVTVTSSNNAAGSDSVSTVNGHGVMVDTFGASRFLAQATLGANYEEIHRTANMGVSAWIEEQFAMPIDSMQVIMDSMFVIYQDSLANDGYGTDVLIPRLYKDYAWWQMVMTSNAQLRHRIAMALSELFVISDFSDLVFFPRASADYYDVLQTHAFGNWRDLFRDVTLHPAMGAYLSHINNRKTDLSINRFPDENYARECMQLFSIGLYELNNDGSRKTDENGNWIPTFDNTDITEIAKVFTGLGFDFFRFGVSPTYSHANYSAPMIMFEEEHEQGQKVILKNHTIPNGQTGMEDIEDVVDVLFNHPNTGPFFSKFLIQRLITSNPSPEYIDRVASTFNNNGHGVRGDIKAVIKTILLDNEARDCAFKADITYGRMKEPLIKYVELARTFNATSPNGSYFNRTRDFFTLTGQRMMAPPSVFNFFQSDFQPVGEMRERGLFAPEFQMLNDYTSMGFHAHMYQGFAGDNTFTLDRGVIYNFLDPTTKIQQNNNINFDHLQGSVSQNFSVEQALYDNNQIDELINRLDLLLTHGNMRATTKDTIEDLVVNLKSTGHGTNRLKLGFVIEMVIASPEYNILH